MGRRMKEFIEIDDYSSLDALIERLIAVRDEMPDSSEAELRMKGDDIFGRKLAISYLRHQTAEEAALDTRYADAVRAAQERDLQRLTQELGVVCQWPGERKRRARAA